MSNFYFASTILTCLCLLLVMFFDFTYFQIPNILLGFILAFLLAANPQWSITHYIPATSILVVGYVLAHFNIMGFGDSKLLAILSVGLNQNNILQLLVNSVLLGGLVGILFIVMPKLIQRMRLRLMAYEKVKKVSSYLIQDIDATQKDITDGLYNRYIPYGIPISIVGIFLLLCP